MDAALKFRATAARMASPRESLREAGFRRLFETTPIGMAICRVDGQIVEANPALCALLGYEHREIAQVDLWKQCCAVDQSRKGGTELSAADSLDGLMQRLIRGEGETSSVEGQWQRLDRSEFWGRLTVTLARNEQGLPGSLMVVLEDVSQRREMEERIRQAEKMEAIGRLSGGIAHDFNNLLTGILLYSDLLLAQLEPESLPHGYVREVRLACEQGAALTQQLLAAARKSGSSPRPARINEVIAVMENFLRRLIGEQIQLITALDPAAGAVAADAGGLRQVLLNLALNARDALGREQVVGGKIHISTRMLETAPGGSNGGSNDGSNDGLNDDARPRTYVLTVEDNGCGMSAETRSHLFEPFFTTKKDGEGTGLGLGTVQRIVNELGGTIKVASAPGSGTCVEVFLPAAEAESGEHRPPESDTTFRDGTNAQGSIDTQVLKFSGNRRSE